MLTPQQSYPALAQALGLANGLYLKREDLHPYGSHKGRSLPNMIEAHAAQGIKNFVISSSGNAALAAIHAIKQHNQNNPSSQLTLKIFVGQKINLTKLKNLKSLILNLESVSIAQVSNPKQSAFQLDKAGTAKTLRQSTDDIALVGYVSLAKELNEIPNLQAIFIPTSSGTTAQALGEGFLKYNPKVQIHIVQTEACHPIAEVFEKKFTLRSFSEAGAIVDRTAHRKKKVINLIQKTNGSGWIVSDEEIKAAMRLVKETTGIDISPNSALSVAGTQKALKNGVNFTKAVACLITGQ